jgi:stage III sporulation protein AC
MDITVLFKMAAIGIIITVICQILKKSDRDDIATLVSIVGLVIVLTVVVGMVGDLFGQIFKLLSNASVCLVLIRVHST